MLQLDFGPIILTRDEKGRLVTPGFPQRTTLDPVVNMYLDQQYPGLLARQGDLVQFTVSNGRAIYKVRGDIPSMSLASNPTEVVRWVDYLELQQVDYWDLEPEAEVDPRDAEIAELRAQLAKVAVLTPVDPKEQRRQALLAELAQLEDAPDATLAEGEFLEPERPAVIPIGRTRPAPRSVT